MIGPSINSSSASCPSGPTRQVSTCPAPPPPPSAPPPPPPPLVQPPPPPPSAPPFPAKLRSSGKGSTNLPVTISSSWMTSAQATEAAKFFGVSDTSSSATTPPSSRPALVSGPSIAAYPRASPSSSSSSPLPPSRTSGVTTLSSVSTSPLVDRSTTPSSSLVTSSAADPSEVGSPATIPTSDSGIYALGTSSESSGVSVASELADLEGEGQGREKRAKLEGDGAEEGIEGKFDGSGGDGEAGNMLHALAADLEGDIEDIAHANTGADGDASGELALADPSNSNLKAATPDSDDSTTLFHPPPYPLQPVTIASLFLGLSNSTSTTTAQDITLDTPHLQTFLGSGQFRKFPPRCKSPFTTSTSTRVNVTNVALKYTHEARQDLKVSLVTVGKPPTALTGQRVRVACPRGETSFFVTGFTETDVFETSDLRERVHSAVGTSTVAGISISPAQVDCVAAKGEEGTRARTSTEKGDLLCVMDSLEEALLSLELQAKDKAESGIDLAPSLALATFSSTMQSNRSWKKRRETKGDAKVGVGFVTLGFHEHFQAMAHLPRSAAIGIGFKTDLQGRLAASKAYADDRHSDRSWTGE